MSCWEKIHVVGHLVLVISACYCNVLYSLIHVHIYVNNVLVSPDLLDSISICGLLTSTKYSNAYNFH